MKSLISSKVSVQTNARAELAVRTRGRIMGRSAARMRARSACGGTPTDERVRESVREERERARALGACEPDL